MQIAYLAIMAMEIVYESLFKEDGSSITLSRNLEI